MRFNLALIFTGLVFLFNPVFNMFDFLPDFLGAVLIMLGLSKMYMYNADFEEAKKSAKFLLWISVLKFVLCIWVNSGHREYAMPFTFIIGILEIIYCISMFKALYSGIEYTLMRSDREMHVKTSDDAFTMSFIFIIAAKLLEFVPHITDIFGQDAEYDLSAGASFRMSMAQMKVYVYFVSLVLGLILGLIYVLVISKAWIRLIADKHYAPYLKEKYINYTQTDREAFMESKIKKIYFLFTLSFAFLVDFYIDAVNVFPTFVAVLLLTGALLYLVKYEGTNKITTSIVGVVSLTVSVINYVYLNKVHLGTNYLASVESYNRAEFKYLENDSSVVVSGALSFLECVLVLTLVFMCLFGMKKLFENEKRRVALPMINVAGILASLACLAPVARNILDTFCGHLLATSKDALDFAQNKMFLTNEQTYLSLMQNPDIALYEKASGASYILAFVSVVLSLCVILYMLRMMRFTDGDK